MAQPMVGADGKLVSYDGGNSWVANTGGVQRTSSPQQPQQGMMNPPPDTLYNVPIYKNGQTQMADSRRLAEFTNYGWTLQPAPPPPPPDISVAPTQEARGISSVNLSQNPNLRLSNGQIISNTDPNYSQYANIPGVTKVQSQTQSQPIKPPTPVSAGIQGNIQTFADGSQLDLSTGQPIRPATPSLGNPSGETPQQTMDRIRREQGATQLPSGQFISPNVQDASGRPLNETVPTPSSPIAPVPPTGGIPVTVPSLDIDQSYLGGYTGPTGLDANGYFAAQQQALERYLSQQKALTGASPQQAELDRVRAQLRNEELRTQLGLADIANQPIAAPFLQGQAAAVQRQAGIRTGAISNEAAIIEEQMKREQAARAAELDIAKMRYQADTDRNKTALELMQQAQTMSKPIEVGGNLVDPRTGRVIYQSPIKAPTPTGSVAEYEYAKSQGYKGSFMDYQNEDANRRILASQVAGSSGMTPQQTQNFLTITNKYQSDQIVKGGIEADSVSQVADQVIANPGSSTSQMKALYSFISALDPGTAVKEGEQQLAMQGQSFISRFGQYFDKIATNQTLPAGVALEMAKATKELASVWKSAAQRQQAKYASQAQIVGLGPQWNQYVGLWNSAAIQPFSGQSQGASSAGLSDSQLIAQEEARRGQSMSAEARAQFLKQTKQRTNDPAGLFGFNSELQTSQNGDIDKLVSAIGHYESGGNYKAQGPLTAKGDRAYGKYQVMGANIPSWTKEVLGYSMTPSQFLNDSAAQDAVAKAKLGQSLARYGTIEDAASVWFSGRPVAKAGNSKDVIGTSVPTYVKNVAALYNRA